MMTQNDLPASPPTYALPCGRALVVDQDRKDLQTCVETLRRMGFEVNAFTTCQEALRCMENVPVDFAFVHQGSAAFEWQEIVQRVLARDRRTPVVVLTRRLDVGCYLEAIHLGAADYVEKPLAPAQIERLVTTFSHPRPMEMRRSA